MTKTTYYEATRDFCYPGKRSFHRGTRMTAEEWATSLEIDLSRVEQAYDLFRPVNVLEPEIDLCVAVVIDALQIGSCNSRTPLKDTANFLKRKEQEATDVAKAYGLRVAHDTLMRHIDRMEETTEEQVRHAVMSKWRALNK